METSPLGAVYSCAPTAALPLQQVLAIAAVAVSGLVDAWVMRRGGGWEPLVAVGVEVGPEVLADAGAAAAFEPEAAAEGPVLDVPEGPLAWPLEHV